MLSPTPFWHIKDTASFDYPCCPGGKQKSETSVAVVESEAESTTVQLDEVLGIETNGRQSLLHIFLIVIRIQAPQCGITLAFQLLLLVLLLLLLLLMLLLLLLSVSTAPIVVSAAAETAPPTALGAERRTQRCTINHDSSTLTPRVIGVLRNLLLVALDYQ